MITGTYDVVEVLVRTPRHVVSRAVRGADGLRVLLKEQIDPAPARLGGLQQELELAQRLPLASVPRPLEIARQGDREFLVVEDRGLAALAARLAQAPLPLDELLQVAIGLCDALADLHAR